MQFALLLARTLGRTLGELLETMSPSEFELWLAEYQRRPWGDSRGDMNAGQITAAIFNMAGKSLKQGTEPLRWSDFMDYQPPEPRPQPIAERPADYFKRNHASP